ncbi:MAG TPA: hypothetical protein PK490_10025 [Prosthecobacter sp.]|nr:hypothetical protein [Prosthecobacter sp.]HRK14618.1 hypothetical protein [Prosthecobacter sp.]
MKSRLPHVILAAVLCSGAARSVEPPRDGIHDDARAFGAQTRQVLAWEIAGASARAGCAFWVSVDSYNGSGRNIRRHARDLRRAWSGDADAVLLAYERSSNQLGFSFSPGLWEKHTPAALAVLVHEAGASMSRTDTSLEERLSGAVSVLLEGMRRLEEGRIRSARPLSIADRRLAAYFTPVLAAGALLFFAAGMIARRGPGMDTRESCFPEVQVGCRFGAPHGGGVVAVAAPRNGTHD